MAKEPGRMVCEPMARKAASEVREGAGVLAAERVGVTPLITTTPLEAREIVEPQMMTAGLRSYYAVCLFVLRCEKADWGRNGWYSEGNGRAVYYKVC
jgi:hypothetical protein